MANFLETVNASCRMLAHTNSDVDKMAALLFATPCIQDDQNDAKTLALLFHSLGPSFLRKMLSGQLDIPVDDDTVNDYRTTALSVLVSFCVDPDLAKNKNVLRMIPHVFDLLRHSNDPTEILEAACLFFNCVIQSDEGRQALLSHNALLEFSWIFIHLKSDNALDFINILLRVPSKNKPDDTSFNVIMSSLALEFSKDQTHKKFKICDQLRHLLASRGKSCKSIQGQKWPELVLKGLKDILTSRIDDRQRVPALKLASAMVEYCGIQWAEGAERNRQFQFLLIHLSSIECRMQMEDQPISSILKNADLIIACFDVLENAIEDLIDDSIEIRQKDQIIESYSAAASAVLSTISAISGFKEKVEEHKIFIYAMIEFLCKGFSYDVLTVDAKAFKYVPFIMKFAESSLVEFKKWYKEKKPFVSSDDGPVNLFEFLIPAFRHFATGKEGQSVIFGQMDLFLAQMDFSWEVVKFDCLASSRVAAGEMSRCVRKSLFILVKMAELFIDTILVDPDATKGVPQFSAVFTKIDSMLPHLGNTIFNPLISTASILALILIRHEVVTYAEEDSRVVTAVNSSVQFLKTYMLEIPRTEASVFQVGDSLPFWVNIREMYLLGVHVLGNLLNTAPWIGPHIESQSPELFDRIKKQSIELCTAPD